MRRNRGQVMYMPRDGKVNEMPNQKTAEEIFAEKDARIAELESELAALKEKMRWRKYDDEPFSSESGNILLYYRSYGGENNFAIGDAAELEEQCAGVYGITHDRQVYKLNIFWRPFDFTEEPNADRTDSAQ